MERLRNGMRAVLVGCVVDLITAQTHLFEVMTQHSCSPPRAERHCHVMRLHSHTPGRESLCQDAQTTVPLPKHDRMSLVYHKLWLPD